LDQMLFRIDAPIIALAFAACMLAAWALGKSRGRRLSLDPDPEPGSKVLDATIALLGLLLAFTFAMTLERREQRRLMVVAHANSIGDFYTCATLLPGPERTELQAAIGEYARHELQALRDYLSDAERRQVISQSLKMHNDMTAIVGMAITRGTPIAISLTNTLNEITSAHASRTAAYEERLPWPVQILLLVTASASAFLLGRQQGLASRKYVTGTICFIVLVSLVVFVIKDLSQPRRGMIRTNFESMVWLVESIKE
jgi:hypothetical protein